MKKCSLLIENIPAILWGEDSSKLFVAVHGNMSNKSDATISILADEATALGYQVLSFDLPKHGDRKEEPTLCKVQNCVSDLEKIMDFAQSRATDISLFACSMGAYFSLLAYKKIILQQSLLLSPVVNMNHIINNMMTWFNVSEERLKVEQEIATPIGETLYWDYYCYVKENPIAIWDSPTEILYGETDNLCEFDFVSSFAKKFNCGLEVMENGEHYFHTPEQLNFFRQWVKSHLYKL
ncbi:MAG: alpha/beta hydrolase [Anaerotignaceae bacterium]